MSTNVKSGLTVFRATNNPELNQEAPGELLEEVPVNMAARPVRDVAIPRATNVTNTIQKSPSGGKFELKQNMVQLLHTNGQVTGLPHEDLQVHLQNFFRNQ